MKKLMSITIIILMVTILICPVVQAATYTYSITINGKTYIKTVKNIKDLPKNVTVIDKITIPGSTATPRPTPTPTPIVNNQTKTYFSKGVTVAGNEIHINGKVYYNKLVINSPYPGYYVGIGKIYPTITEQARYQLVEIRQRQITTTNSTIAIRPGDSFYGDFVLGEKFYQNTYVVNVNSSGKIIKGILWPLVSDIPSNATKIVFP